MDWVGHKRAGAAQSDPGAEKGSSLTGFPRVGCRCDAVQLHSTDSYGSGDQPTVTRWREAYLPQCMVVLGPMLRLRVGCGVGLNSRAETTMIPHFHSRYSLEGLHFSTLFRTEDRMVYTAQHEVRLPSHVLRQHVVL
jgi:hypothetical protein